MSGVHNDQFFLMFQALKVILTLGWNCIHVKLTQEYPKIQSIL